MLKEKLLLELQKYLDENRVQFEFSLYETERAFPHVNAEPSELENYIITNRKASFAETLFNFIDQKGLSDADVYKKAGIDRRHFSKIRSNPDYRLGKNAAISLAIALQLNSEETDQLLSAAGYSLSDNDTFDLIIKFCLEKKIYDIDDVNQALEHFSIKPLIRAGV
ncbi:hypothetical protein [Virgibacillus oceani]|uniref:Appr-1-p processing protein n=1 Tax=Virgibacillus oceani TaxID=1479511 RepID=A0A917HP50_9BACI|nr:hypothetical protein [Virgibacillus oceani]GGG84736.1 hypothetical protein GCM10011398_33030 [Virgibacillus oceani]